MYYFPFLDLSKHLRIDKSTKKFINRPLSFVFCLFAFLKKSSLSPGTKLRQKWKILKKMKIVRGTTLGVTIHTDCVQVLSKVPRRALILRMRVSANLPSAGYKYKIVLCEQ